MNRIRVHLDRRVSTSYDVFVGDDFLDRVGLILARENWASRYLLVSDDRVAALHGERVLNALGEADLRVDMADFPAGEASKTFQTCLGLVDRLVELGADRTWGIIALGGGVVGDVAGFTASMFMRGIPHVQVPTTLLAQVDSSIGGKTGVDLPQGKNLLGTFHQPKAVFSDASFLGTLPRREIRNGLAEILKYGLIEDPEILTLLESGSEALEGQNSGLLIDLIGRSCRIKKAIVEGDETEKGLRRILNFGHTIGHALEAESGYSLSHGEAVAIGMIASSAISERLGYLPPEEAQRVGSVTRSLGLPDRVPETIDVERAISRLRMDKKRQGDTLPFVLLKRIGIPFMNGNVPESLVREIVEVLQR